MDPGSIVIVHLHNPTEKYWGVLQNLSNPGLTLRGINISSFDDWTRSIAYDGPTSLGLVTVFFPLMRLERMFLDEPVGEVESMSQIFKRQVGTSVEAYLGIGSTTDA